MKEIRVCQVCDYQRGFHVSFRFEDEGQRLYLVCPNCGQSYDIGWVVSDLQAVPRQGRRIE